MSKGEKRFEELKSQNEEKRRLLQELKIANDDKQNLNGPAPKNEREYEKKEAMMRQFEQNADENEPCDDVDYIKCVRELQQLQAELDSINERKRNVELVADQLGGWVYRCATKLNSYLDKIGHGEIQTEGRMNHEIFEDIRAVTGRFLEEQQTAADSDDGREKRDLEEDMRAFRSEQYLTKNIRIIPTGADDEISMRGDDYEDDLKFQQDAQHDVEKLREKVRQMYEDYQERVERELAEAARNADKRR